MEKKFFTKTSFADPFLLLAIFLFSIFLLSFLNSIPHLDGNIDFVEAFQFFKDGWKYSQYRFSIHLTRP